MNLASPTSLYLARKLLALEENGRKSRGNAAEAHADSSLIDTTSRVCQKLQRILTAFAGSAGFRSLLTRALSLAKVQEPLLAGVSVLKDGALTGFQTLPAPTLKALKKAPKTSSPGQLLIAHLLDLLVTFIGEPLMLQLVRSAWPDASPREISTRIEESQ